MAVTMPGVRAEGTELVAAPGVAVSIPVLAPVGALSAKTTLAVAADAIKSRAIVLFM
jgi:hypothetical protein